MTAIGMLDDACAACAEVDEYAVAERYCEPCDAWLCVACFGDHPCDQADPVDARVTS